MPIELESPVRRLHPVRWRLPSVLAEPFAVSGALSALVGRLPALNGGLHAAPGRLHWALG